jgi:hypothetical protein
VNTPNTEKDAPAAESGSKRHKRTKGKLVRLNDLISEQDIKGGQQALFGVTHTTQTKSNALQTERCERRLFPPGTIGQNFDATSQPPSMRGGCSPPEQSSKCPPLDLVVG